MTLPNARSSRMAKDCVRTAYAQKYCGLDASLDPPLRPLLRFPEPLVNHPISGSSPGAPAGGRDGGSGAGASQPDPEVLHSSLSHVSTDPPSCARYKTHTEGRSQESAAFCRVHLCVAVNHILILLWLRQVRFDGVRTGFFSLLRATD